MKQWFNNLKIGVKITCGFLIVAVLAGVIGGVGILSLNRVGDSYHVAYSDSVTALECMERISASFQEIRADLFKMTLADDKADKEACAEALNGHREIIDDSLAEYKEILVKYKEEEVRDELKLISALESAINTFAKERKSYVNDIAMDTARRGEAFLLLNDGGALDNAAQTMGDAITELITYNQDYAAQQINTNEKLATTSKAIMGIGILVGVLLAMLIGLFISRGISKRIGLVMGAADKLTQGNFDVRIEVDSSDETGVLAQHFRHLAEVLKTIISDLSGVLHEFAEGNFTVDSGVPESYVGDYAPLLASMRKMRDTLSDTLKSIDTAAGQVATASAQVSAGAQALATGSTEQASSIEELSAGVERIAEQATENSTTVKTSAAYIEQAGASVNAGNAHMEYLTRAMVDIDSASGRIANITKVIEDIAFQTNILALNAAIEAARAGSAGKGFAVVADEVRSLAAKSAEAARQTGELICASVDTVAKGTELTAETAKILQDVGAETEKVTESFKRIEHASAEQAEAIVQIKQGILQISAVVQTNAATAEENSATSEEMSAQAATLHEDVKKFKLTADMGKDTLRNISLLNELPTEAPPLEAAWELGKY